MGERRFAELRLASVAGLAGVANEDYVVAGGAAFVVVDGSTARIDGGCAHGVAWYARQLGNAILGCADSPPKEALRSAIGRVAGLHSTSCDLAHPGTPAAAVLVVQVRDGVVRYALLGDVTLLVGTEDGLAVVTDDRIRRTALAERAAADRYPIGSAEKERALELMKWAEVRARDSADGYWIASSDPEVVEHALTGTVELDGLRCLVGLTDGATRMVETFRVTSWGGLLSIVEREGVAKLLERTRRMEDSDPLGARWPRNKKSDDATVVHAVFGDEPVLLQ